MKTYYKTFADFWRAVCEAKGKAANPVHHRVEVIPGKDTPEPQEVPKNDVPHVVRVEYLRKVEGHEAPPDSDAVKLHWQTLEPVALRWEKGWILLRAGARAEFDVPGDGNIGFSADDVIDEIPPRRGAPV